VAVHVQRHEDDHRAEDRIRYPERDLESHVQPPSHSAALDPPPIPMTVIWCWINLLPFTIDNQRQAEAIQEDPINKPWRPLPSGRLTPSQARNLMLVLYPVAVLTNFLSGGLKQSIMLLLLGFWYNDCGGADRNCLLRNPINGAGFICYTSGAMEVAYGSAIPLSGPLLRWSAVVGATVASTVQTQDMYDQAGDSVRHRQTIPSFLDDAMGRWTIAIPVVMWSWVCPWL